MARWRASVPSTTSAAAWLCEFGLVVLFAAGSRRARALSSFWYQLSRKQSANGPLTNHFKWWGRVPEKGRYAPPSVTFLGVEKFTALPNITPQLRLQRSLWSTSFNCKVTGVLMVSE